MSVYAHSAVWTHVAVSGARDECVVVGEDEGGDHLVPVWSVGVKEGVWPHSLREQCLQYLHHLVTHTHTHITDSM